MYLTSGQTPRLTYHVFQEGRLDGKVLRYDVKTKQMAVDTFAAHGIHVPSCVDLRSYPQQTLAFRILKHKLVMNLIKSPKLTNSESTNSGPTYSSVLVQHGFHKSC